MSAELTTTSASDEVIIRKVVEKILNSEDFTEKLVRKIWTGLLDEFNKQIKASEQKVIELVSRINLFW